jgi:hypothetical protein
VTVAVFGFAALPATELACEEYDALWDALNGRPRGGPLPGKLTPFSGHGDSETGTRSTAWGFRGQDTPALAEWVPAGRQGRRHWLFAAPRDVEGAT